MGVERRNRALSLLVLATIMGASAAMLGMVVRAGPVSLDVAMIDRLQALADGPLGGPLDILSRLGSLVVWDTVALVAVALWFAARRWDALLLMSAVALAELLGITLKVLVNRPRPETGGPIELITNGSYPSSHVVRLVVTIGTSSGSSGRDRASVCRAC